MRRAWGAAIAAVLAAVGLAGCAGEPSPAPPECVEQAGAYLAQQYREHGHTPVTGTVEEGDVMLQSGITSGMGFRLTGAQPVTTESTPAGDLLVWHPISSAHSPKPGRNLLLLAVGMPGDDGAPQYEVLYPGVYPIHGDAVILDCAGTPGRVELAALVARITR